MRTWYSAVVLSLNEKGARNVELQDIYSVVEKFRSLTDHDREPHPKYPQENFKHTIRSVLAKLKKYGLVDQTDRAIYSLTKKSLENIDAFTKDNYGKGTGKEIDIEELLERFERLISRRG